MIKERRSIKICRQSGYQYRETPAIILRGQWLIDCGFEIGDYVCVSCENGKLVIVPDEEKAKMIQEENEFLEREIKALKKRFKAEKKKLHMQYVAEKENSYGKG